MSDRETKVQGILDELNTLIKSKVENSDSEEVRILAKSTNVIMGMVSELDKEMELNMKHIAWVRDKLFDNSKDNLRSFVGILSALEALVNKLRILEENAEFVKQFTPIFEELKEMVRKNLENIKRGEEGVFYG